MAIGLAILALIGALLPHPGFLIALGIAIFAGVVGWLEFRAKSQPAVDRLAGAGAVTIATIALVVAGARFAAVLVALDRLQASL